MIIYGSTFSPFVRKLVAYCTERDMDFEIQAVGLQDPDPGFRAASPLGKMPAIRDGAFGLADSSAIIHYLEAKYPDGGLIPVSAEDRGRTVWFDEYADTVMTSALVKVFFNRVVAPLFLKREGDEAAAKAAARDELPIVFAYLEDVVPDAGGYLVGDRLTLADLAVASPLANLAHCREEIDPSRFPRLSAWAEAIHARPSFAKPMERERGFLERTRAQD